MLLKRHIPKTKQSRQVKRRWKIKKQKEIILGKATKRMGELRASIIRQVHFRANSIKSAKAGKCYRDKKYSVFPFGGKI